MRCPYCRGYLVGGEEFCPNCGANLNQVQSQNQNVQIEQPVPNIQTASVQQQSYNEQSSYNQEPPSKNEKKKFRLVPIIVVVILVIIGVVYVNKYFNKNSNNTTTEETNKTIEDNNYSNSDNENNTIIPVEKESNKANSKEIYSETAKAILDKENEYDQNGSFLMQIEDVFTVTGKGTVVTGKVLRGSIHLNDKVEIIGLDHKPVIVTIMGIEIFKKDFDMTLAGENASIYISDVHSSEVERGQVLAKPNSVNVGNKFEANIYALSEEEGGRHTPFFTAYNPQIYFRTTDINGTISLLDGIEMVMPGDNAHISVSLEKSVAMEVGTIFKIHEGGRIVAVGEGPKILK